MERIIVSLCILLFSLPSLSRDPLAQEDITKIINEFQYAGNYTEVSSSKSGGMFSRCWTYTKVITTEFPQMIEPLRVHLRLYIPNRNNMNNQVPAVIMIPPIGGINFLDKKMANTFCDSDVAAIVLTDDFANIDSQAAGALLPPQDHQQTFYRIAAAIKASMAMVDDDADLNYEQMGIFGVSLGGILSSFVMATQPDISAGYFVVAGGDVPDILAYSQQSEVSAIRRKRMKAEGFSTKEEYLAFLRQHITLDPIDLASTMLPETLSMVIAERDKNVPTPNQIALHAAFGAPDAIYYNEGHVDTVVATLWSGSSRRQIARFFMDRFALANPRPAAFTWLEEFSLAQYM